METAVVCGLPVVPSWSLAIHIWFCGDGREREAKKSYLFTCNRIAWLTTWLSSLTKTASVFQTSSHINSLTHKVSICLEIFVWQRISAAAAALPIRIAIFSLERGRTVVYGRRWPFSFGVASPSQDPKSRMCSRMASWLIDRSRVTILFFIFFFIILVRA